MVTRPISAGFIAVCALVIVGVSWSAWRGAKRRRLAAGLDEALGLPGLEVRGEE